MLWAVIAGLVLWIALQARQIMRLQGEVTALERRLAAFSDQALQAAASAPRESREPLLLTQVAPPDDREPLLLDTPVPDTANDWLESVQPQRRRASFLTAARSFFHRFGLEAATGAAAFVALAAPSTLGAPATPTMTLLVCGVAGAGLGLALWRRWAWTLAGVLAGLFWAFASAVLADAPSQALAYLSTAGLGAAALARRGRADQLQAWRAAQAHGPGVVIAACSTLAFLPWLAASQTPLGAVAAPALTSAAFIALAATAVRLRWAAAPVFAAAVLGLGIGIVAYLRGRYPLPTGSDFFSLALFCALAVVVSAHIARPHHRTRTLVAGFAAIGSGLLVATTAFTRAEWHGPAAWGALLAGGAVLLASAWSEARRSPDVDADRAVDLWVAASGVLFVLGLEALLGEPTRALGHGLVALAFAQAAARIGWRGLRWTAVAAAAVAVLSALAHADNGWLGLSCAALSAGAVWMSAHAVRKHRHAADGLEAVAAILAGIVAFTTLGALARATGIGPLALNGLQTVSLLGPGLLLTRWRPTGDGLIARWGSEAAVAAGLTLAALGAGLVLNPWWGATNPPSHVAGTALLNPLLLAYAAPGALLWIAGKAPPQRARWLAQASKLAGAALMLMWATLEVRRAFHPEAMREAAIGALEGALYALLALGAALAVARAAHTRHALQRGSRFASWAALAFASAMLLVFAYPRWDADGHTASFALALLLRIAAAGAILLLAAAHKSEHVLLRWSALVSALLLIWSAGDAALQMLFADRDAVSLARAAWPLGLSVLLWTLRRWASFCETSVVAVVGAWAGLAIASGGLLVVLHPWWGLQPVPLPSLTDAALGLASYAAVAGCCLVVSEMRQAPTGYWLQRAGLALAAAHVLGLAMLAVRRFHHATLREDAWAEGEGWAYAATWAVFGATALWLGVRRNSALLRLGGLAASACAVLYFFYLVFTRLSGWTLLGASVSALAVLAVSGWFASIYRPAYRNRRSLLSR